MSTTQRTFRIDDELYALAAHQVWLDRTTVTAVVTAALKRYVSEADVSVDTQERTD